MGKKVFVSYKYSDSDVYPLARANPYPHSALSIGLGTTARHYVDELQDLLDTDDHINKGEQDGQSLAGFKDSTIASRLRDKIFDSSITVVLISPNMKERYNPESDQWIPWEISYSLSEHSRNGITSRSNALLAVVLPDRTNSYNYFIQENTCCSTNCKIIQTDRTFGILGNNMFNLKNRTRINCSNGNVIYHGTNLSYVETIKWQDFKGNINWHLNNAVRVQQNINDYEINKRVA